mmetsp:Transcript_66394/g.130871  ORF Transcript_66394/g.130871 Transcript_66394/m.130871 type:complete len:819 (-) Transcript_66394:46-2502(-)
MLQDTEPADTCSLGSTGEPTTDSGREASTVLELETSVQEAIHCVISLAQSDDPDEAADLLRCECEQAPLHAVVVAQHAVLEAYIRAEKLEAAFELCMQMVRQGQLPAHSQELVLRALVQGQLHVRAADLLRAVCAAGVSPPGDAILNGVVDAAVRARSYGEAWDVLELLLSNGRRADKYFVSILTKSLESSGDRRWVRRGIGLVDRFIEHQREDVDEIVFNSLLNVLGHVGDMQKLRQTLNKMNDYNVPPSAVTYGTVVKAYGKARDIEAVLQVWHEMRGRCLGVNPVTCGCVLDACVKCGHLDKAMAIFQEMKLQGLHKNTVLYATLIKGLAKVRDLMGAVHLYQEMRLEAVPCNLVTFNSLMDVCVRCGDLQTAALFLQDMMQMGIEPDLITFSTLIKGYSHTGEVHKAMALAKELKSRGLKCDEIMYNSLIDGCAKANKVREGLMVFEDMLHSRVSPSNITFSILVKLHFEAGQMAEAFRLVDEMSGRYRCAPSRVVYTVLLRCCAQHGGAALLRGAALLCELAGKRNSKMPDQGMVSAIVSGCAQHLDFDTAIRLVHEFTAGPGKRGNNLVPFDCIKTLIESLSSHDEMRAVELMDHLRRKGIAAMHLTQLQAALAEGRMRASVVTNVATATIPAPSPRVNGVEHANSLGQYSQWPQAAPYHPQPYVQPDIYPQYQAAYLHQMGYHAGYQSMPYVGGGDAAVAHAEPMPPVTSASPTLSPLLSMTPQSLPSSQPAGGQDGSPSPAPITPTAVADKENKMPTTQFMKENMVASNTSGNVPVKQKRKGKRAPLDAIALRPMQQLSVSEGKNNNLCI